jgi:Na+/melibiose symporter-like transporter
MYVYIKEQVEKHTPLLTHDTDTSHQEDVINRVGTAHDNATHGWEADLDELSKGYYFSRFFLGTFLAVGLSIWAGTAAFGYAASILAVINEDLGPDDRYVWISLVYNTCLAVFLSPVGRLSDIFGRRYFFIAGAVLAVVGSIVCATANSILVLIGKSVWSLTGSIR